MVGMMIKKSEYKVMPWKNGMGHTAEIDRFPKTGDYLWRLSQAPILSDGPFSLFPGYDRLLCICEGKGIILNQQQILPLQPLSFSGDQQSQCQLIQGPVKDVGLIFNRTQILAEMAVVEGLVKLDTGRIHYLYEIDSENTLKIEAATEFQTGKAILISVKMLTLS